MAVRYRGVREEQVGAQRRGYVERSCALYKACMRHRMLHGVSCRGALVLHQLHSSELKQEENISFRCTWIPISTLQEERPHKNRGYVDCWLVGQPELWQTTNEPAQNKG